jgi:predicted RNA binding protein with dsRBD fold (UPF0201 family)
LKGVSGFPVTVRVEAPLQPSEDPQKVADAVRALFGDDDLTETRMGPSSVQVVYSSEASLMKVYEQVRSRRTLSVFRRLLRRGLTGGSTTFLLNRQAATRGLVVLCDSESESPLGPIFVTIESSAVERIIDWLAPGLPAEGRSFGKGQHHG